LNINLSQNPLIAGFFNRWPASRAENFALNLLTIGIGVANKLLEFHPTDEAFRKLNTMASKYHFTFALLPQLLYPIPSLPENVVKEYIKPEIP
jgi:hypothetical protein